VIVFLRKVKAGKLAPHFKSSSIPRARRFFGSLKETKMASADESGPTVGVLPSVHTAKARRVVPPHLAIRHVLSMSSRTKIRPAIVESITVAVINNHVIEWGQQEAMEEYVPLACPFDFRTRIPQAASLFAHPLVGKHDFGIGCVDNGELASVERDEDNVIGHRALQSLGVEPSVGSTAGGFVVPQFYQKPSYVRHFLEDAQ